jgi:hypothetical protein
VSAVERIAVRAQARAIARVAEAVRAALPGTRVEAGNDRVTIAGRGVVRDARLRWIAGLLK